MELYGIDSQELPKNVGNKGTCPFTFKGQWIRIALISRFGRMFDQYVFFHQAFIGQHFSYFSCLSAVLFIIKKCT